MPEPKVKPIDVDDNTTLLPPYMVALQALANKPTPLTPDDRDKLLICMAKALIRSAA